jgi:DNA helicase-2/ATP-dependent DNA helicase PcrA
LPGETFLGEPCFIRDRLNLEAELLAHLRALVQGQADALFEPPGEATRTARVRYAAERLRLMYVGITRARRSLIVSWNAGRLSDGRTQAAVPFTALHAWWQLRHPRPVKETP